LITYSRQIFGFAIAGTVLAWKLGRKPARRSALPRSPPVCCRRAGRISVRAVIVDFRARSRSVGSERSTQQLLARSIVVSIFAIQVPYIGNFPIVGIRNLVSHNAYAQVSAACLRSGLIVYLVFYARSKS